MKLQFNRRYFIGFLLVLVTEVAIAVFYFHRFVRGFLGDVLAVPLVYLFLKTFFNISVRKALIITLCFAFLVELGQYLGFAQWLNSDLDFVNIAIGNKFDWWDILAYSIGGFLIWVLEKLFLRKKPDH